MASPEKYFRVRSKNTGNLVTLAREKDFNSALHERLDEVTPEPEEETVEVEVPEETKQEEPAQETVEEGGVEFTEDMFAELETLKADRAWLKKDGSAERYKELKELYERSQQ